eukprot:5627101-Alexandrium_andersonii.AAC.1
MNSQQLKEALLAKAKSSSVASAAAAAAPPSAAAGGAQQRLGAPDGLASRPPLPSPGLQAGGGCVPAC